MCLNIKDWWPRLNSGEYPMPKDGGCMKSSTTQWPSRFDNGDESCVCNLAAWTTTYIIRSAMWYLWLPRRGNPTDLSVCRQQTSTSERSNKINLMHSRHKFFVLFASVLQLFSTVRFAPQRIFICSTYTLENNQSNNNQSKRFNLAD